MATNPNEVNFGFNKFCGPAVLSILTSCNTDEAAAVLKRVAPDYKGKGAFTNDILKAANLLGFDQKRINIGGGRGASLFSVLMDLVNKDGFYLVVIPKHFVTLQISEKKAFFCDNHTGKPIPASSSARLMQRVDDVYQFIPRIATVNIEKIDPNEVLKQNAEKYIKLAASSLSSAKTYISDIKDVEIRNNLINQIRELIHGF